MFRFRLGKIPIEVQLNHLLLSAIFGYSFLPRPGGALTETWPFRYLRDPSLPEYGRTVVAWVLCWMVIVSVSVLIHELGHALASLAFGYRPAIFLTGFGGHTLPQAATPIPWHKDVVLTVAGPLFGLALGIACGRLRTVFGPQSELAIFILTVAYQANIFWAALNLVPILPLDGGRISNAVLGRLFGRRGFSLAQGLGLVLAIGIAIWGARRGDLWLAVLFGFLGIRSLSLLASYFRGEADGKPSGEHPGYDSAAQLYQSGRLEEARRRALQALDGELSQPWQARFHHLLGWISLKEGEGRSALDHFSQVQGQKVEPEALAAGFSLIGDEGRALPLWELAYRQSKSTLLLHEWAGALIRANRVDEAAHLPKVDMALAFRCAERVFFLRGLFLQAAQAAESALKQHPAIDLAYDGACAYARAGRTEDALRLLEQAATLGFADFAKAQKDGDLASLSQNPGFQAWLERLRHSTAR